MTPNQTSTLDQIRIEVKEDALPDGTTPKLTQEIIAKVFALDLHPFERAIFEFIYDAPRTIQPPIAKLFLLLGVEQAEDGSHGGLQPMLIAMPNVPGANGQAFGPATELGMTFLKAAGEDKLTAVEIALLMTAFPGKIDGFDEHFDPEQLTLPEGCDGKCDTCTRHDHEKGQG